MNVFTKYTKSVLVIAILLALLVISGLFFRSITKLKKINDRLQTEKSLALQSFEAERNEKDELIVYQDVVETQNKHSLDSLTKQIDWMTKIKRPKIYINEITNTKIDSLFVSFTDTLLIHDSVNIAFRDSTEFYAISGKLKKSGILFDKISFVNDDTYVLATKRHNLFFNKTVLYVHHKNPYTSTLKLNSITLQKQPKPYTRIMGVAAAFILGVFLENQFLNK